MPRVESTVEVDTPVDIAVALSQTYGPLRYRWDPFVREQHLLDGHVRPGHGGPDVDDVAAPSDDGVGVRLVPAADPGRDEMVSGPWFFEQMSGGWSFATIDHQHCRATWRKLGAIRIWARSVPETETICAQNPVETICAQV